MLPTVGIVPISKGREESYSRRGCGLTGGIGKNSKLMKNMIRILMAVVVAAAFVCTSNAADEKVGKGKGPAIVKGENVLMTCPHCKDDYVVKLTQPPKGTEPQKAYVGTHQCGKCSTKLTTKGAGKAKTEVTEHTCKGCEHGK